MKKNSNLTPEQENILFNEATELPGSSELNNENIKPGSYRGRVNSEPENNRKTLMDLKNASR